MRRAASARHHVPWRDPAPPRRRPCRPRTCHGVGTGVLVRRPGRGRRRPARARHRGRSLPTYSCARGQHRGPAGSVLPRDLRRRDLGRAPPTPPSPSSPRLPISPYGGAQLRKEATPTAGRRPDVGARRPPRQPLRARPEARQAPGARLPPVSRPAPPPAAPVCVPFDTIRDYLYVADAAAMAVAGLGAVTDLGQASAEGARQRALHHGRRRARRPAPGHPAPAAGRAGRLAEVALPGARRAAALGGVAADERRWPAPRWSSGIAATLASLEDPVIRYRWRWVLVGREEVALVGVLDGVISKAPGTDSSRNAIGAG